MKHMTKHLRLIVNYRNIYFSHLFIIQNVFDVGFFNDESFPLN